LQSVQFVTIKGKRVAVLNYDDWEALVEWLETLEDSQIANTAFAKLKAAGGDRSFCFRFSGNRCNLRRSHRNHWQKPHGTNGVHECRCEVLGNLRTSDWVLQLV
jgi:hypothetical protein